MSRLKKKNVTLRLKVYSLLGKSKRRVKIILICTFSL